MIELRGVTKSFPAPGPIFGSWRSPFRRTRRVVLDGHLRTPPDARLFSTLRGPGEAGGTVVLLCHAGLSAAAASRPRAFASPTAAAAARILGWTASARLTASRNVRLESGLPSWAVAGAAINPRAMAHRSPRADATRHRRGIIEPRAETPRGRRCKRP